MLPEQTIGLQTSLLIGQVQDHNLAEFLSLKFPDCLSTKDGDRSLEMVRTQWESSIQEKWFHFDVRDALDRLYLDGRVGPRELAQAALVIVKRRAKSFGVSVFQHWLQCFLSPQTLNGEKIEDKDRLVLTKQAVKSAQMIKPAQPSQDIDDTGSLVDYPANSFIKFKAWRKELSRRFDQINRIRADFLNHGILIMSLYSVFLTFFDLFFTSQDAIQNYISLKPFWGYWILLLLVCFINFWLVSCILALTPSGKPTLKPWVNHMLVVVAGLPIWGGYVFPFYAWLVQSAPDWLRQKEDSAGCVPAKVIIFPGARVFSTWFGNTLWRKGWFWWGVMTNLLVSFICVYFYLTIYIPLGGLYKSLGFVITLFLHLTVFLNGLWVFWLEGLMAELRGWRLWLQLLTALFWLVPIPGLSFAGLIVYVFSNSAEARHDTVVSRAFENVSTISRDPAWTEIKKKMATKV